MKVSFFILIAFLIAACLPVKVSYDYSRKTDFTKFKAYAYKYDALKVPAQEVARKKIMTAIDKEMHDRGFATSDNPDIWVDFQVKSMDRTQAIAPFVSRGYSFGSYYGPVYKSQPSVDRFIDCSLVISVMAGDSLVWQGRGTKSISGSSNPDRADAVISLIVSSIFRKFPIQTPGSN